VNFSNDYPVGPSPTVTALSEQQDLAHRLVNTGVDVAFLVQIGLVILVLGLLFVYAIGKVRDRD